MIVRPDKRRVEVNGIEMAYVEAGEGNPIVLLHGNPTSSYLWRDVIPHIAPLGRCIAPDLVGMGDSAPPPPDEPDGYRFVGHRRSVEAFLTAVGVEQNVTLVGHDWGSALAFDWANRHRASTAGIIYMEGIVRPRLWIEWPEGARRFFQSLRSPAGEEMILERNLFVERVLPASVLGPLSQEVMDEYRRPFREPGERRRPMLTWSREIPIDGEPADVVTIVNDYSEWLSTGNVPKLFVNAEPGSILIGEQREFCRSWPNQSEVTVPGLHFVQEDSGDEIGRAIASWLRQQ